MENASGMNISAFGNTPLRVVADADDDPVWILKHLDSRYASNRTVSRIDVQTQLFRMRCTGKDITLYTDDYTLLFNQLEFLRSKIAIPEAHRAPMLFTSIDSTSDL